MYVCMWTSCRNQKFSSQSLCFFLSCVAQITALEFFSQMAQNLSKHFPRQARSQLVRSGSFDSGTQRLSQIATLRMRMFFMPCSKDYRWLIMVTVNFNILGEQGVHQKIEITQCRFSMMLLWSCLQALRYWLRAQSTDSAMRRKTASLSDQRASTRFLSSLMASEISPNYFFRPTYMPLHSWLLLRRQSEAQAVSWLTSAANEENFSLLLSIRLWQFPFPSWSFCMSDRSKTSKEPYQATSYYSVSLMKSLQDDSCSLLCGGCSVALIFYEYLYDSSGL